MEKEPKVPLSPKRNRRIRFDLQEDDDEDSVFNNSPGPTVGRVKSETGIMKKRHSHARSLSNMRMNLQAFIEQIDKQKQRFLENEGRGASLYKLNRREEFHKRWFELSRDGTEIRWRKAKWRVQSKSRIRFLADVKRVLYLYECNGTRKDSNGNVERVLPWFVVSLLFHEGTPLHMSFDTETEAATWFLGLQSLGPVTQKSYVSRGTLLWYRFKAKIMHYSDTYNFGSDFLCMKVVLSDDWHKRHLKDGKDVPREPRPATHSVSASPVPNKNRKTSSSSSPPPRAE